MQRTVDMDKLESVTRNNLLWLDTEMCDHTTWLGTCITALLCRLATYENTFFFEEPWIFREWMLLSFFGVAKHLVKVCSWTHYPDLCFKNGIVCVYHPVWIYAENEAELEPARMLHGARHDHMHVFTPTLLQQMSECGWQWRLSQCVLNAVIALLGMKYTFPTISVKICRPDSTDLHAVSHLELCEFSVYSGE